MFSVSFFCFLNDSFNIKKGRKLKLHSFMYLHYIGVYPQGLKGKSQGIFLHISIKLVFLRFSFGDLASFFSFFDNTWIYWEAVCARHVFQVLWSKSDKLPNSWALLFREVDVVMHEVSSPPAVLPPLPSAIHTLPRPPPIAIFLLLLQILYWPTSAFTMIVIMHSAFMFSNLQLTSVGGLLTSQLESLSSIRDTK